MKQLSCLDPLVFRAYSGQAPPMGSKAATIPLAGLQYRQALKVLQGAGVRAKGPIFPATAHCPLDALQALVKQIQGPHADFPPLLPVPARPLSALPGRAGFTTDHGPVVVTYSGMVNTCWSLAPPLALPSP